ncbi:hypothetical protein ARUE_232p01160 (plasmid) [Arthrobacter sp. Rue61a]|nr:hypothetical protein ARUE_232p01160 [Arthrobacter sp. Rue61a]
MAWQKWVERLKRQKDYSDAKRVTDKVFAIYRGLQSAVKRFENAFE